MTNEELRTAIKTEIKEKGYSLKDVTVSVQDVGYSTAIRLVIRNPKINRKDIKDMLKKYGSVDRDMSSGEILAGGNTYTNTYYAEGIFDEVASQYETVAEDAMKRMWTENVNTLKLFDGLYLEKERNGTLHFLVQRLPGEPPKRRPYYSKNDISICIYKFKEFGDITA